MIQSNDFNMREYFFDLTDKLEKDIPAGAFLRLSLQAEDSQFTRFNHAKMRNSGLVRQADLKMQVISDKKQSIATLSLELGSFSKDLIACRRLLAQCIAALPDLPEDPFVSLPEKASTSESPALNPNFNGHEHVSDILKNAHDTDLVGIYAGGNLFDYYWDSIGSRHEKSSSNFNFDYSLQVGGDKAVKRNYAGFDWKNEEFSEQLLAAKQQCEVLRLNPMRINPGKYRVYMTPAAADEVFGVLAWGGFSLLAYKSGRSPLQRLYDGSKKLSPLVNISESPTTGTSPLFTSDGDLKPAHLDLVKEGRASNHLVSNRSANEFKVTSNGADEHEIPAALTLAGGSLAASEVLNALDTGLLIGNLWYLNYSDRLAGQITGMTRFATFWVENGQIKAPTEVMRFDESIFNILGDNLLALSHDRDFALENRTYHSRQRSSTLLPGLLIKDFSLTL